MISNFLDLQQNRENLENHDFVVFEGFHDLGHLLDPVLDPVLDTVLALF